jgi:hypothetical protein
MKNKKAIKAGVDCSRAYVRGGVVYCWLTSTTCESTKNRGMCKK